MGTHHYDVPKLLDKARHGYRRARSSQPSGCFTAWAVGRGGVSATRGAPPCPALLLRSRPPIPAPGQAGPGGVTMAGSKVGCGAERDLAARLPTVASDLGPTGSWGMIGLRGEALRFWESSSRRFQSRILQYYFTTVAPKETDKKLGGTPLLTPFQIFGPSTISATN